MMMSNSVWQSLYSYLWKHMTEKDLGFIIQ